MLFRHKQHGVRYMEFYVSTFKPNGHLTDSRLCRYSVGNYRTSPLAYCPPGRCVWVYPGTSPLRSDVHRLLMVVPSRHQSAMCSILSCKNQRKISHHIGAPRRSGAWKALLLVTEGNALGPHVRPISICLEGSTPQDRTSPSNEICPTRPNPCFKRNGSVDIQGGIIEPVPRHRCPH